ncbi:unnamed protein product [Rotaria sp. Silwood1]|nr:unnamed protein product [Rotaria sp. Silwood1]CAF4563277.1 unnamed protein product [Rotaria sp. Silwood1]
MAVTNSGYSQVQQWAATQNNAALETLENTLIDNSGNVYTSGTVYISVNNSKNPVLVKYNSAGVLQWQKFMAGVFFGNANSRGCSANTSLLDNSGNIFVAGGSDSSSSAYKGYLVKYNPNGDSLWCTYAGINDTLGFLEWYSMKMDNSGNIYVAGYNLKSNFAVRTFIVAKYNSSGVLQWVKNQYPAVMRSTYKQGFSLQLDNSNNVYIAATIMKSIATSSQDIYMFKLNSSGAFQWEATYDGTAGQEDIVSSMKLDLAGNVYVEVIAYSVTFTGCSNSVTSTGTAPQTYPALTERDFIDTNFYAVPGSVVLLYLEHLHSPIDTTHPDTDSTGTDVVRIRLSHAVEHTPDRNTALSRGGGNQQIYADSNSVHTLLTTNSCVSCDLSNVYLPGANLNHANLSNANLNNANLSYASLNHANLNSANLSNANLSYADLSNADLSNASLNNASLSYANLSYASLSASDLSYANLSHANLSYTNGPINGINMSSPNLSGANLTSANFTYATLNGANLSHANLTSANLSHATLVLADLSYANLSNANFCNAIKTGILRTGVITNSGTQCWP